MDITVPQGVSSVTFAAAGVKAVVAGKVTGVGEEEGTQVCASYNRSKFGHMTNPATGQIIVTLAPQITSITVNGNVYPVAAGLATMSAVDATAIFNSAWTLNGFRGA